MNGLYSDDPEYLRLDGEYLELDQRAEKFRAAFAKMFTEQLGRDFEHRPPLADDPVFAMASTLHMVHSGMLNELIDEVARQAESMGGRLVERAKLWSAFAAGLGMSAQRLRHPSQLSELADCIKTVHRRIGECLKAIDDECPELSGAEGEHVDSVVAQRSFALRCAHRVLHHDRRALAEDDDEETAELVLDKFTSALEDVMHLCEDREVADDAGLLIRDLFEQLVAVDAELLMPGDGKPLLEELFEFFAADIRSLPDAQAADALPGAYVFFDGRIQAGDNDQVVQALAARSEAMIGHLPKKRRDAAREGLEAMRRRDGSLFEHDELPPPAPATGPASRHGAEEQTWKLAARCFREILGGDFPQQTMLVEHPVFVAVARLSSISFDMLKGLGEQLMQRADPMDAIEQAELLSAFTAGLGWLTERLADKPSQLVIIEDLIQEMCARIDQALVDTRKPGMPPAPAFGRTEDVVDMTANLGGGWAAWVGTGALPSPSDRRRVATILANQRQAMRCAHRVMHHGLNLDPPHAEAIVEKFDYAMNRIVERIVDDKMDPAAGEGFSDLFIQIAQIDGRLLTEDDIPVVKQLFNDIVAKVKMLSVRQAADALVGTFVFQGRGLVDADAEIVASLAARSRKMIDALPPALAQEVKERIAELLERGGTPFEREGLYAPGAGGEPEPGEDAMSLLSAASVAAAGDSDGEKTPKRKRAADTSKRLVRATERLRTLDLEDETPAAGTSARHDAAEERLRKLGLAEQQLRLRLRGARTL
ncbi:MAG: hypothetical protein ABW032_06405 [Burkholderiaceae bacterium]